MKNMLIVLNIVFLLLLISAPVLKKINRARLFTIVMLLVYSIGIIKLVCLFPVPCLSLLCQGMLTVLSIALLARQKPVHRPMVRHYLLDIFYWNKGRVSKQISQ